MTDETGMAAAMDDFGSEIGFVALTPHVPPPVVPAIIPRDQVPLTDEEVDAVFMATKRLLDAMRTKNRGQAMLAMDYLRSLV